MSSQKTKNKGNKARAYGGKRSAEGEQELIQRQLEEVLSERDVAKVKRDLHIAILKRNLVSLVEKGIAARALDLTPGDLEDIKVHLKEHAPSLHAVLIIFESSDRYRYCS